MGNFNRFEKSAGGGRGNRYGGRSYGDKNYGDRDRGFGGNRSGGGRNEMHKAICANCGNSCEVPFKPTGDRPVYCSNCFEEMGGNSNDNSRSYSDRRPQRASYGDRDDREMFTAVCDNCGNTCELPFKPTSGKPVYCSNCFDKKKESGFDRGGSGRSSQPSANNNELKDQITALNHKLDRILSVLESRASKEQKAAKALEESKAPEVAKEIAPKKAAKAVKEAKPKAKKATTKKLAKKKA